MWGEREGRYWGQIRWIDRCYGIWGWGEGGGSADLAGSSNRRILVDNLPDSKRWEEKMGKSEGEKVCCGGGHGTPLVRGVAWL